MPNEYRVLATNKTSTMEKEMKETAAAGFRFSATTRGETALGCPELVRILERAVKQDIGFYKSFESLRLCGSFA